MIDIDSVRNAHRRIGKETGRRTFFAAIWAVWAAGGDTEESFGFFSRVRSDDEGFEAPVVILLVAGLPSLSGSEPRDMCGRARDHQRRAREAYRSENPRCHAGKDTVLEGSHSMC